MQVSSNVASLLLWEVEISDMSVSSCSVTLLVHPNEVMGCHAYGDFPWLVIHHVMIASHPGL